MVKFKLQRFVAATFLIALVIAIKIESLYIMLSTSTRLKIQEILERLSKGESVSFNERVYLNKFADRDQSVYAGLNKAKRVQRSSTSLDSIDTLLTDLCIGCPDPDDHYNQDKDLGDWFKGAPSWIGRS